MNISLKSVSGLILFVFSLSSSAQELGQCVTESKPFSQNLSTLMQTVQPLGTRALRTWSLTFPAMATGALYFYSHGAAPNWSISTQTGHIKDLANGKTMSDGESPLSPGNITHHYRDAMCFALMRNQGSSFLASELVCAFNAVVGEGGFESAWLGASKLDLAVGVVAPAVWGSLIHEATKAFAKNGHFSKGEKFALLVINPAYLMQQKQLRDNKPNPTHVQFESSVVASPGHPTAYLVGFQAGINEADLEAAYGLDTKDQKHYQIEGSLRPFSGPITPETSIRVDQADPFLQVDWPKLGVRAGNDKRSVTGRLGVVNIRDLETGKEYDGRGYEVIGKTPLRSDTQIEIGYESAKDFKNSTHGVPFGLRRRWLTLDFHPSKTPFGFELGTVDQQINIDGKNKSLRRYKIAGQVKF